MNDLALLGNIVGVAQLLDEAIQQLDDAKQLCCRWAQYDSAGGIHARAKQLRSLQKRMQAAVGSWKPVAPPERPDPQETR